jgi:hypothetical protein
MKGGVEDGGQAGDPHRQIIHPCTEGSKIDGVAEVGVAHSFFVRYYVD